MPYKAIKKFEFDGVVFKIGDTVPDRLIVERLINSKIVEEFQNVIETPIEVPEVELLLETPSAIEVTVETTENVEEKKEELLTEEVAVVPAEVPEVKETKKNRK